MWVDWVGTVRARIQQAIALKELWIKLMRISIHKMARSDDQNTRE